MSGLVSLAFTFTACDDYGNAAIGYEDIVTEDTTEVTPPEIDSQWQLKIVSNNGQNDRRVFVYQDKLYDAMFSATTGWTGGDIVFSYRLPDGKIVWGARDSYFGVVDPKTRARNANANTVRTAMLIQDGDINNPKPSDLHSLNAFVQTTNPDAKDYYNGEELLKSPRTNRRYYPLIANYSDNQLHLLLGYFATASSTRYSTAKLDYNFNGKPGDAGYLQLINSNETFNSNTLDLEQSQLIDDGYTYMYGSNVLNGNSQVLVCRVKDHKFDNKFEYYILDTDGSYAWVDKMPDKTLAAPRSNILADNGACQYPQVVKDGKYYYLIGQKYANGNAVYIWRSKSPAGPFTDQKTLFVVPEYIDKIGNRYYSNLTHVIMHQSLSRKGELVFSTTQTTTSGSDNFTYPGSADYLRPYFFRVFNWQALFE